MVAPYVTLSDPCARVNGNGYVVIPPAPAPGNLKGEPVLVFQARRSAGLSDIAVDVGTANMLTIQVYVTGGSPSAVVSVEGGTEKASYYLPLADPNASKTVTQSVSFDVVCGARWAKIRLASVTGSYNDGEGFTIWVTPYVAPGQPRVTADHIGAGQTAYNTGVGWWMEYNAGTPRMSIGNPAGNYMIWDGSALTVAGAISALSGSIAGLLTIGASGALEALGTGSAMVKLDNTGLKLYDSGGIQRGLLSNDGSGWLGSSTVFSWTTAGVVTLNGSAIADGSIASQATNFGNIPIIGPGITITNNSPVAGSVAWNTFGLTHKGISYMVSAGSTANKFIWWNKATSTTVLQTGATPPAPAADQFLVILNLSGAGYLSLFQNIVYSDYISTTTLAAIQANIGAAHIDGVLDVAAAGGIYQGSGSFAVPTTGLKVWNDSGIGRIGGYSGGVLQWSATTGGVLTAGAGDVTLDANGVTLTTGTYTQYTGVPSSRKVSWTMNGGAELFAWNKSDGGGNHAYLEIRGKYANGYSGDIILTGEGAGTWPYLYLLGTAGTANLGGSTIYLTGTTVVTGTLEVTGDITADSNVGIANSSGDAKNTFRLDGFQDTLYIVADSATGAAVGTGIILRTQTAGAGAAVDRLTIAPDGATKVVGKFGCNNATPQAKQVSGGTLGGVITALVNVGILSS